MAEFLFEIGLEEVPARMIANAEAELGSRTIEMLRRERLLFPSDAISRLGSPASLSWVTGKA